MMYLFRIISDENPDFLRDLVAGGSDTFLDFHMTLQKDLDYDPTQLASFFITNDQWEKEREITLIDMMQDPGQETFTMEQVRLEEMIDEIDQRMLYLFDFFSERAFFIELIEKADQTATRETPFIAYKQGDPPDQISLDQLLEDSFDLEDFESQSTPENLRLDDLDLDVFDSETDDD